MLAVIMGQASDGLRFTRLENPKETMGAPSSQDSTCLAGKSAPRKESAFGGSSECASSVCVHAVDNPRLRVSALIVLKSLFYTTRDWVHCDFSYIHFLGS